MPGIGGRAVVEYAGKGSSKDVSITANSLQVLMPGVQVTLSSIQVVDVTPSSLSKAVSQSSGTVKGSAGTLFHILPTTAGDFDIKDGNTSVARIAVTTVPFNFGPWGIPFTTSISISASAAVGTFVYK